MNARTVRHTVLAALTALAGCAGGSAERRAPAQDPDDVAETSQRANAGAKSSVNSKSNANASSNANANSNSTKAATAAAPKAAPRPPLSPRAQRLFEEAVAAREEMTRLKVPVDWETLERRWRTVVETEDVPEAWYNLGVALEHRRMLDDARAAYRRALAGDPGLASAAVNLALLDEPKDPREAGAAWAELMRRFPADAVPPMRLAALYEAAGQLDEASRLAREALVRDPKAVGAYPTLARVALARGNPGLAQLLTLKAQKLTPGDAALVSLEGDALAKMSDEPGAIARWTRAVQLQGDYLPARYALLSSALSKRHWEGAAEQARAILTSDPSDARVQLALGIAYRYLGQPDKALAAYDQAEKLSSDRLADVHLARGIALMKSKEQCEPAIAELHRYVAAAGPLGTEGPALRLVRECEQIVAANRQAEEAAREMKAEAEREAAKAEKRQSVPAVGNSPEAQAPHPAPASARADGRASPTR